MSSHPAPRHLPFCATAWATVGLLGCWATLGAVEAPALASGTVVEAVAGGATSSVTAAVPANTKRTTVRTAEDQWYLGTLNDQPAVQMRQSIIPRDDGSWIEATSMTLVIRRALQGHDEMRIEIRESSRIETDPQGRPLTWRFDHEENGATTTARGTVGGGRVMGTLHRLGRATAVDLAVPPGDVFLSDRAAQDRLVASPLNPGDTLHFSSLGLVSNRLLMVDTAATFRGTARSGTMLRYELLSDVMPTPIQMGLDRTGKMIATTMDLGILVLELKPSNGPIALLGADLAATGLVKAVGPVPRLAERNRFRLPTGVTVPEDAFQRQRNGLLEVNRLAQPGVLDGSEREHLLAAEPNLELDDPELRHWVGEQVGERSDPAAIAEQLRQAVRSRISKKDLSQADATALETFRSQTGDCTEHATLLCAALRIAGIPARVEIGLVYASDYGGWVGHAWTSAWLGDRWGHLDSAYPGIPRSCYIRLGSATGAPGELPAAKLLTVVKALGGKPVVTIP